MRDPSPESKTLRVLMLAPTPFFADRGCHVRIYEEARALMRLGHEVCIVTYHLGRDMPGIPTCRIPSVPWYGKLAAGPSWHKPYLDILLLGKAISVAHRFRPDIIHAHLHEGAFIGLPLARFLGVPMVFDCQGSLTGEMLDHGFTRQGTPLHWLFKVVERFVNKRSDFIITSSGAGAADLRETWGCDNVTSLIDGVDTEVFAPCSGEEARNELNLPSDRPVAAFLGVLNSYQGIDLLLDVVRIVRDAGVPLHFLIMGFPDDRYRQVAAEMGIADRITFTGRIDYAKAPFLLAAADIALSPKLSRTEANGKLLNYMACGLPTVVFDTPVNREILGDTGVYARFADAADFAKQLMSLVQDLPLRKQLAVRVREKAEREHSWSERAGVLLDIYRRMPDGRN